VGGGDNAVINGHFCFARRMRTEGLRGERRPRNSSPVDVRRSLGAAVPSYAPCTDMPGVHHEGNPHGASPFRASSGRRAPLEAALPTPTGAWSLTGSRRAQRNYSSPTARQGGQR
jgi:hypothetical protein